MIWVTSDSHMGHPKILEYCDRPFSSVEEMDNELIKRWNNNVKENDIVYHLGDFTLGGPSIAAKYFLLLNGKISIIASKSHHDRMWINTNRYYYSKSGYKVEIPTDSVTSYLEPTTGNFIVFCHFPFAVWDRAFHGSYHLHGHSHGRYNANGKILDVGVDCHNYTPISLDNAIHIIDAKVRIEEDKC